MSTIRRLVKSTIANTFHQLSLDKLVAHGTGKSSQPLIICYHRVVENFQDSATRAMPSLLVSSKMFEKQLDWLAQNFDMVTLEEAVQTQQSKIKRSRRQATISFDDGYADFYWNAVPILKEKGIPSSVFVVTDIVGTNRLQTHDELYLLLSQWYKRNGSRKILDSSLPLYVQTALARHSDAFAAARYFLATFTKVELLEIFKHLEERVEVSTRSIQELQSLTWPMLRTLHSQGITVGSHTRSHALLPNYDNQELISELQGSREKLNSELGSDTKFLAYPDGQFDERRARAAQLAGYEGAVTICDHLSKQRPQYTMPRQVLWENSCIDSESNFSPAVMGCLINGLFNRSSRCTMDHSIT